MRNVDRAKVAAPSVLKGSGAKKELREAAAHFNRPIADGEMKEGRKKRKRKSFKFGVYKDDSLKKALHQLFHGKCAYCESRYASVHPMDVEHWRPKGAVYDDEGGETKLREFGYYWLAAAWENLLPSCIDCNRERKYQDPDGNTESLGKGNWFPLRSGSRARSPGEEVHEVPLLIDPCKDDPEHFLFFREDGFVIARGGDGSAEHEKALSSIRYYGLNRAELVLDRLERIRLIQQKIVLIENLLICVDLNSKQKTAPPEKVRQNLSGVLEDLLSYEIHALKRFQSPQQPYSLMARQVIAPFIAQFSR